MDEERHKYRFISYVNVTVPYSSALFPQFMLESILKTAFDDDDFEFKVKAKPFPVTHDVKAKGSYLGWEDNKNARRAITMDQVIQNYSGLSWAVATCIAVTWYILNTYTMLSLMRERNSMRKKYLESHGQSKASYWLARYGHDLFFYLPTAFIARILLKKFESNMIAAPSSVLL